MTEKKNFEFELVCNLCKKPIAKISLEEFKEKCGKEDATLIDFVEYIKEKSGEEVILCRAEVLHPEKEIKDCEFIICKDCYYALFY